MTMKSYIYFLVGVCLFIAVFVIGAPFLISAKDDLEVTGGYFLIAISVPMFVWIGKNIWLDQQTNFHKLKGLMK